MNRHMSYEYYSCCMNDLHPPDSRSFASAAAIPSSSSSAGCFLSERLSAGNDTAAAAARRLSSNTDRSISSSPSSSFMAVCSNPLTGVGGLFVGLEAGADAFLVVSTLKSSRTALHHCWTFFSPQPGTELICSGCAFTAFCKLPNVDIKLPASDLLMLRGAVTNSTNDSLYDCACCVRIAVGWAYSEDLKSSR